MNVLLFGASGMVGRGVLLECLDHPQVKSVTAVVRRPLEDQNPKLKQVEHQDFENFESLRSEFQDIDACFYCMGVSSAGMDEEKYTKLTYDFGMAAGRLLHEINPGMTYTYVSGQGTDSTEKGRTMWARVKGKLENDLLGLGFARAVMFRPGGIIPRRGIKSRTALYQFIYNWFGWLLWLIEKLAPNSITDTTRIGLAMINVHLYGTDKTILDPADINALAER